MPSDPTESSESPGDEKRVVAGRYRLRSVIGSGSMGTVWSAYDEFLHRPVAVKEVRLPPGVPTAQADELRERTLREARAIAVLSHPNVIILHDVARENDEPFVVMELLPSRSLAHILRDHGPLTVEQAAAVGIAVASALEAAHAAGITHRDVKPGNVLVAVDGRIKLTDFGIARNVSEATMTRTGMMLGSPAYIAPEVASGGAVVPAADLWGLGATLFAAIEGSPPYDADGDPLETVGKVVNGKVPKPGPGPLSDVIGALMKKEPSKRITLREVRRRLYPLQAKTLIDLFPAELFHTPDGKKTTAHLDATDTQVIKPVVPDKPGEGTSSELAADPGPLPFLNPPAAAPEPRSPELRPPAHPAEPAPMPTVTPAVPRPPSRSAAATVALALASVVIFLLAAGGGFVLARAVGGQDLRPPEGTPRGGEIGSQPPPELVTQQGDASTVNGVKGGRFSISVPKDWKKFVAPHVTRGVPSTVVQYVSPDGGQVIRIERLTGFLAENPPPAYFSWLKSQSPEVSLIGEPAPVPGRGDNSMRYVYRTTERSTAVRDSSNESITRTTFMDLFSGGADLWILSVTSPIEQETSAKTTVFEPVAQSLVVDG
ncbi:serine/threonine protein kinase [Amycolatopsis coloradensis]|uniref:non-specific serine/threonine protein kinase n=1 Tax=Amycolatopsis coloradensis TaxID=76021 RepID=A0A1R0KPV1_9PSEU|nr:serine/threonine-protein kinase [Amycolatopsis coloradensis]OLZ49173.1 serine/threonine protein kinase [Amycolatopsis coloradensis]